MLLATLLFASIVFASKRYRTNDGVRPASNKRAKTEVNCNPVSFEREATALLQLWDSNQAQNLWRRCMSSGVLYNEGSVETAMQLFQKSIAMNDSTLLKDSVTSQKPEMYRIFVSFYLRILGLSHVGGTSDGLREAVKLYFQDDRQDGSMAYFLSPLFGNVEAAATVYQNISLNVPERALDVIFLLLMRLFPTEHILSKLNMHSVQQNPVAFDKLIEFCETHGIDLTHLEATDISPEQKNWLTAYIRKEQATPEQLIEARRYTTSAPRLIRRFFKFLCMHQRQWAASHNNIHPSTWALLIKNYPYFAPAVPLPDQLPDITQYICRENNSVVNNTFFNLLAKKFGLNAVVIAMNNLEVNYSRDEVKGYITQYIRSGGI